MENLVIYAFSGCLPDTMRKIEWLTECIEKRLVKGQAVTAEHLAESSTIKKIVSESAKYAQRFGEMYTKDEKRMARRKIADKIINDIIL